MYYTLSFLPGLNGELAKSIEAIRRKHDPTSGFTKPHVTVVFPVPDRVREQPLIGHIEHVLRDWEPFDIRFGGLHKSHDHWLFLTLAEGEAEIRRLYQQLYTGILAEFRRGDIEFVPHLGLGLFLREGAIYDWDNPREADFDLVRYREALGQAEKLPLHSIFKVDRLRLTKISDEVLDWATGKRASFPRGSQPTVVREFLLGEKGA